MRERKNVSAKIKTSHLELLLCSRWNYFIILILPVFCCEPVSSISMEPVDRSCQAQKSKQINVFKNVLFIRTCEREYIRKRLLKRLAAKLGKYFIAVDPFICEYLSNPSVPLQSAFINNRNIVLWLKLNLTSLASPFWPENNVDC